MGTTASIRRYKLRRIQSGEPIYTLGCPALPKYQMRACSRKLSTIRVTRMLQLYSCPGIRQQMPRTIRSIFTPFCDTVEPVYHYRVLQGVHLQDDSSASSFFYQFYFFVDQPVQFGNQVETCHKQPGESGILFASEGTEQVCEVMYDDRIAGKQSAVCIQCSRLLVEVAGTDISVTVNLFTGEAATAYQSYFGMYLQPRYTIDNVDTSTAFIISAVARLFSSSKRALSSTNTVTFYRFVQQQSRC